MKQMAHTTRLFTLNQGEEAVIRVNTSFHITLEFSNCIMTVFQGPDGIIFSRMEYQAREEEDVEEEEPFDELVQETQLMMDEEEEVDEFPLAPAVNEDNITVRRPSHTPFSRTEVEDLEELQMELFGSMEAGDTQII